MYLKVLKFILMNLWYLVRWLGLALYHGLSALYRRRQSKMTVLRPRTVYAGRWLLADDPQFCGRAIVVQQGENLRPGVELLYFGEESADPYFGERYFMDHGEATRSAEQMLLRFLGGRYRRRHPRTSSPAVTLPAVVNGVNDGHASGPGREAA
ncbi:hypothetical protein CN032_08885 [Salmonella enterica subsp. enterica serovar Newport]|nr:hypothetical protein [Salmonella enterica subsp. enterica serovar Newport]